MRRALARSRIPAFQASEDVVDRHPEARPVADRRKPRQLIGARRVGTVRAKLQKRAFSESPPEDYADLGIAQPTEIFITPSFELVDLIPEELQDYNRFSWAAGVATHAKEPAAAAALIRFLTPRKPR